MHERRIFLPLKRESLLILKSSAADSVALLYPGAKRWINLISLMKINDNAQASYR